MEQPLDQWAGLLAAVLFTLAFATFIYDGVWGGHLLEWIPDVTTGAPRAAAAARQRARAVLTRVRACCSNVCLW